MKFIKWSQWSPDGMLERGEAPYNRLRPWMQAFEKEAREHLNETGADHVLYGRAIHDRHGALSEVRFYKEPVTDEELDRIAKACTDSTLYVVHRR